jgi:cell division protein FtsI/penicillin-binding protein 2
MRTPKGEPSRRAFDGYDVHLTLDLDIQDIVENELAAAAEKHHPECGAAVVMDVRDGSVLAMASWPTFNPQTPAGSPIAHQRNVAVSDAYEFGSAFKPIVAAVALQNGVVTPATEFDCHGGEWRIGRRTLHDAHEYGLLSVQDIIVHSSNIGMAQISMLMGLDRLYSGVRAFGFGRPTGVALPGEVGGIVRPYKAWNDYSVVSVSFGQEIAVTALSMARAFAALANGGALLQPRIVERIRHSRTGEVIYESEGPTIVATPVDSTAAQHVLEMLRVTVSEGTGRRAQNDEYVLAGKTGTAQLLSEDGRGYADSRYLSSFVAVGPVPDCRIAVLVTLKDPTENGYYGSTCAAPAVGRIAVETLRCLRVPPTARALALNEPH